MPISDERRPRAVVRAAGHADHDVHVAESGLLDGVHIARQHVLGVGHREAAGGLGRARHRVGAHARHLLRARHAVRVEDRLERRAVAHVAEQQILLRREHHREAELRDGLAHRAALRALEAAVLDREAVVGAARRAARASRGGAASAAASPARRPRARCRSWPRSAARTAATPSRRSVYFQRACLRSPRSPCSFWSSTIRASTATTCARATRPMYSPSSGGRLRVVVRHPEPAARPHVPGASPRRRPGRSRCRACARPPSCRWGGRSRS